MSEKRIYLMRHARPELPNGGGIYYGQLDLPISDEGRTAAAQVGDYLKDKIVFDRLYTSDLRRTKETAGIVAPYLEAEECPALREINLGEWEGRTFDEVREQFKEIYESRGKHYSEIAPPGGENFLELQQRVLPAFDKIASSCEDGNILIVGHGAAIWSIMSAHFGFNLDHWLFFPQEYCGIHVLEPYCGRFKISRYNWSPTLTG